MDSLDLQAARSILFPFIFETKNTYVLPFENEMKIEIIGKEYEWRELYKNSFHVLHFYRGNFRKNCKELYSVPRFLRILNIFAKVSLILASMKGLNLLNVVESRYEPRYRSPG